MAIGDISAVGLGSGVVGTSAPVNLVGTLGPTPATVADPRQQLTAETNSASASSGTHAVGLNSLVQALNRLASSSSLLQPAAAAAGTGAPGLQDRLVQLNVMVAAIDVNVPLSQQPMADALAGLLIDLLNDLNQQRHDTTANQGASPMVELILAQALLQPSGTFVNTTA